MSKSPQKYQVRLENRLDLNERFSEYHFKLTKPHELFFTPGQFVSLQVNPDTWRSYSITSRSDNSHGFELLVDHRPAGIGTSWLKNLPIGSEITTLAPLGEFALQKHQAQGFNFAATGCGIAPLRSMLLELLQIRGETRPINFYWGMRYEHELFWLDDFANLEKSFPNFNFAPILSRPDEKWTGLSGHVTDVLVAAELISDGDYYLCGSPITVGSIRQTLQKLGVPEKNIRFEQY